MNDLLSDGRRVRKFNVIVDYKKEALAVGLGLSFPATWATRVLKQLEEEIFLPKVICIDMDQSSSLRSLLRGMSADLLR